MGFLLILDRILPDMDGLDILKEFREKSKVQIPILILSALNTDSDILSGLQLGAIDYIGKPFSIYLLVQKALNLLKEKSPDRMDRTIILLFMLKLYFCIFARWVIP
ncbi:MAG: response regulator [Parachlamydiaceae bacterium]|nr:MAG: response regulator [Parachlamydiaceae bacterium]